MTTSENLRPSRILFSAYACDPREGSEAGAGWSVLQAAAELADNITVITRAVNAPTLEIEAKKLPCAVEILRISTPFDESGSTYKRYLAWIMAASIEVKKRSQNASIFHHATFASDWMFPPVLFGLSPATKFVWGPAGGNTYPPLSLLRGTSFKFAAKEVVRWFATKTSRSIVRSALQRKVDVFIALNRDSGRSAPAGAQTLFHSNCVLPYEEQKPRHLSGSIKTVLFVGRLIDLKGLFLVRSAFEKLGADWQLILIGDGPLRRDLEDWAASFGGRVSLLGHVPHADIMDHMSQADVLLFPGLHDTAPWSSAEAAAAGLPVVCLDLGGVAQMAGENAVVVDIEPVRNLGARIAQAVEESYEQVFVPQRTWTMESMEAVLEKAYAR